MGQVLPFEIFEFVKDVAARNGLELSFLESSDPTTTLVVQPMDARLREGPNRSLVRRFVEVLNYERSAYALSRPVHIEAINGNGSPLPFGITENLPQMIHLVQISALE